MNPITIRRRQAGVALVASMIFLLVVTIISVVAANNSRQGLVMSGNLQDSYDSFQSAEAGVIAAVATIKTDTDVFDNTVTSPDIFSTYSSSTSPLRYLNSGHDKTTVDVYFTASLPCPIVLDPTKVFSGDVIGCDYYRIESTHQVDRKARTVVTQGIVKEQLAP